MSIFFRSTYILLLFFSSLCYSANFYKVSNIDTVISLIDTKLEKITYERAKYEVGFVTSFSDKDTIYKCKFIVINDTNLDKLYINFGDSNDKIIVKYSKNDSLIYYEKAGSKIPQNQKSVRIGRSEFILLKCNPNDSILVTAYVIHQSKFSRTFYFNTLFSFKIYTEKAFETYYAKPKLFTLFFLGAVFIMIFYNLVLAINLKSRGYAFYVLYTALFALFIIFAEGYIKELLLPNSAFHSHKLQILITPLMLIAFLQFVRIYLQTDKFSQNIDKSIIIIILLWIASYGFFVFGFWAEGRYFILILAVFSLLATLFWSLKSIISGYYPARYFFSANLLLLISGIAYVLYLSNIIPRTHDNIFIEYLPQIASIFDLGISSLGLANRIKVIETDMLNAQISAEQEKQQIIEEKNEELELKVKYRTEEIEIQKANIIAINEQLEEKVRERTKKLQKAYRDLLNLNYELDSFIYRAAHDIRGPITTIMGLTNLALLEKDYNKSQEYLSILDKFSKNTQVTLNRILSVNDIKNNHIKPTKFNLKTLKEAVLAFLIDNPHRNKVELIFEMNEEAEIYYDFHLTQLIVQNIIDNAIRFRSNDPNAKPYAKAVFNINSEGLQIIFSDNGQGIEDHIKDKIFDMFFRGNEYSSGSGLGLYIARIAAKKLYGSVELVSSNVGYTELRANLGIIKMRKNIYMD